MPPGAWAVAEERRGEGARCVAAYWELQCRNDWLLEMHVARNQENQIIEKSIFL